MRQHVNPLSRFFRLPLVIPPTHELFENPELPIHLDIGSARGKFLLAMAQSHTDKNYLGLEIRKPLVLKADAEREQLGLGNLRFIFCNANVSLEEWLVNIRNKNLALVSIQFPDPWFKRRHRKRRVLQPSLLLSIASALKPGRGLFIQSDVLEIIKPMADLIEITQCFDYLSYSKTKFLQKSCFPMTTEREQFTLDKGLPVYRAFYQRNKQTIPKLLDLQKRFDEKVDHL